MHICIVRCSSRSATAALHALGATGVAVVIETIDVLEAVDANFVIATDGDVVLCLVLYEL